MFRDKMIKIIKNKKVKTKFLIYLDFSLASPGGSIIGSCLICLGIKLPLVVTLYLKKIIIITMDQKVTYKNIITK